MKNILRCTAALLSAAFLAAGLCMPQAAFADTETGSEPEYFSHCKAGILYEATTDTVLYEKNADEPLIPASMTKVMTAIVTLEHNPDLSGELTVCEDAVSDYYCSWMDYPHLVAGETISYYQCVEYMMLPSANEAANALAFELGSGDRAAFVQEMNDKAADLGCESVYYLDPHGLSTANRVSARDMVTISQYAMSFPVLKEILSHESGVIPANDLRSVDIEYSSILYPMWPDDRYENPYSDYITGLKTGWIPQSGYNYACCMEKDGLEYYIVAMGGDEEEYPDGSGRVWQGDFRDVIEILSLTDGLTADDLNAMHGGSAQPAVYIVTIGAGILGAAVIVLLIFIGKRNLWNKKKST